VPRHQLGQVVPQIGDRKFASVVQSFLHEYGEISIDRIQIVAPYEEDASGHPRVRALQNHSPLRFEMAEAQMPANITNFEDLYLGFQLNSTMHLALNYPRLSHSVISTSLCSHLCKSSSGMACWTM
jgi:hypothetical protein